MLFSSYQQLRHLKYCLYLLIDLVIAYGLYQYLSDPYNLFDWVRFLQIYFLVLVIQLIFIARDGIVNAVFMKLNQRFLVQGIVADFKRLGFPQKIDGVDSAVGYFESVIEDSASNLPLKLSAAKYLHLLQAMQSGASGWVNHYLYTTLLETAIHQHVRSH